MALDTEGQPFLKYSGDPAKVEPDAQFHRVQRRTTVLSHSLVFILTSSLWILAILFFGPDLSTERTSADQVGNVDHVESHEEHSSGDHGHGATSSHYEPVGHNITSDAKLLTCGNSAQEARAQGCVYDILLNNWVPAPCSEPMWVAEYQDDGSWGGFRDKELKQQLSLKEMEEADWYYTSIRDHVNHCAFMWRKQFWAMFEEHSSFDTVIANPYHTDHCAQYLIDVMEKDWKEPTKTQVGFAGCWVKE